MLVNAVSDGVAKDVLLVDGMTVSKESGDITRYTFGNAQMLPPAVYVLPGKRIPAPRGTLHCHGTIGNCARLVVTSYNDEGRVDVSNTDGIVEFTAKTISTPVFSNDPDGETIYKFEKVVPVQYVP